MYQTLGKRKLSETRYRGPILLITCYYDHFVARGGGGAKSIFPVQQYWCDSGMYSALVLVWYIPLVARG